MNFTQITEDSIQMAETICSNNTQNIHLTSYDFVPVIGDVCPVYHDHNIVDLSLWLPLEYG